MLQQATGTDYSAISQPADDPDLLKGIAGSPYAIKDYFDVSPDYAVDPKKRLLEFKALLGRLHKHHLKALIISCQTTLRAVITPTSNRRSISE
ncbi:MAG: hypothetical protein H0W66_12775 [Chthoniobacterales bacterium]|nr:hypothetical protein [Chthoniobacterales bacterium]